MGLGGKVYVFYVLGGPQAPVKNYNHRGLGGKVYVFYVFGGPQAPETTIIIRVLEARCAYFSCLEAHGR